MPQDQGRSTACPPRPAHTPGPDPARTQVGVPRRVTDAEGNTPPRTAGSRRVCVTFAGRKKGYIQRICRSRLRSHGALQPPPQALPPQAPPPNAGQQHHERAHNIDQESAPTPPSLMVDYNTLIKWLHLQQLWRSRGPLCTWRLTQVLHCH